MSVIIPTFKRAHLIGHVLDRLCCQSCMDFEVVVVIKPSGDGTEQLVQNYRKKLDLKVVLQDRGCVTDALNLGLDNADGSIICFLDDDALPAENWVTKIREFYSQHKDAVGVAGDVVPVTINDKGISVVDSSEVIPKRKLTALERRMWSRPVEGLEDYGVYLSKAGIVEYNSCAFENGKTCHSLLGMGANLSVLSSVLRDFRFPSGGSVCGIASEQQLAFHLWLNEHKLFFCPEIKVFHIRHDVTLSRGISSLSTQTCRYLENCLLYYRFRGVPSFSRRYRILWFLANTLCFNKIGTMQYLACLRGMLASEVLGLKWTLIRLCGGKYQPSEDIKRWTK